MYNCIYIYIYILFIYRTNISTVHTIGAGYIAVELAGVLNGLGTDTSLFVRKHCALREFDTMISSFLDSSMKDAGMYVYICVCIRVYIV